jgi:hypothetical protein
MTWWLSVLSAVTQTEKQCTTVLQHNISQNHRPSSCNRISLWGWQLFSREGRGRQPLQPNDDSKEHWHSSCRGCGRVRMRCCQQTWLWPDERAQTSHEVAYVNKHYSSYTQNASRWQELAKKQTNDKKKQNKNILGFTSSQPPGHLPPLSPQNRYLEIDYGKNPRDWRDQIQWTEWRSLLQESIHFRVCCVHFNFFNIWDSL